MRRGEEAQGGVSGMTPTDDDNDDVRSARCWSCDGSGEAEHDCGEDTCCCANPMPGVCRACGGTGRLFP